MARSLKDIKQEIGQAYLSNENVRAIYGLDADAVFANEFSIVSIESLLFDAVAFSIWTLEKLFDIHKEQIDKALYEQKSGTERWYKNKALSFQYGFDIIQDTDYFDNGNSTNEQIQASKIVKYCSVKESQESNRLIMKIASENGAVLSPLSETQKTSFLEYMNEIKYAGVKINVINNPADILQLKLKVFRDPLVLDENGNNILNGGKPLETATNEYLKNLPFDGELVLNDFIEFLRRVPGINNVHIYIANSKFYDVATQDYTAFTGIDIKVIPMSGYFEVENFDQIDYVV